MVRHMPNRSSDVGVVFHAQAHPTRRAVVARLSRGPASVSELARPFEMAMPSFLQHLRVLETGGLVRTKKVGRVRIVRLSTPPLNQAEKWLSTRRSHWKTRLDQLDDYLTHTKESSP